MERQIPVRQINASYTLLTKRLSGIVNIEIAWELSIALEQVYASYARFEAYRDTMFKKFYLAVDKKDEQYYSNQLVSLYNCTCTTTVPKINWCMFPDSYLLSLSLYDIDAISWIITTEGLQEEMLKRLRNKNKRGKNE